MDKNKIKQQLAEKFLKEESTPGITTAKNISKENKKINADGVNAIDKDMAKYDKALKQEDKNINKMATNKFNYVDDAEKTYHDEMEILNGQEMIEYRSEPGSEFTEKAKEAIEGSSRMGNEIGGNAEASWGSASDKFGKKLVDRIKDSSKKRADAEIQTYGMGDVQIPTGNKVQTALVAVDTHKAKGDRTSASQPSQTPSDKTKIKTVKENESITPNKTKESMKRLKFKKEFKGVGNALKLIPESYKVDKKEFEMTDGNETYRIRWEGTLTEGKAVILKMSDKKLVNEDIDRMKALFNYKSEATLGLVKGNARIDENKAFADVYAKTKKLLGETEDIEDVKAEEGNWEDVSVPQAPEAKKDIEGSVATEKKTNAPEPKKGNWEEAKTGKKASSDKGTEAPKPKEGNWEEAKTGAVQEGEKIESVKPKKGPFEEADVKHAPEAKKDVEGTVPTDKKTEAKKPKEAPFEEAPIDQAPEAKKDIVDKKATATNKAKTKAIAKDVVKEETTTEVVEKKNPKTEIVKEEEEPAVDADDEGGEEETSSDKFMKPDAEDAGMDDEKEPEAGEISKEPTPVPTAKDDASKLAAAAKITLLHSPSQDAYFLKVGAGRMVPCPKDIADLIKSKKMSKETALEKIEDAEAVSPEGDDIDMMGEDMTKEGLFSKSPEEIKNIGMEAIKKHPAKQKAYKSWLAKDPAVADKYVMFVGNNPNTIQIAWDAQKGTFYDASKSAYGMASGA